MKKKIKEFFKELVATIVAFLMIIPTLFNLTLWAKFMNRHYSD
jgi:hypothetical protein